MITIQIEDEGSVGHDCTGAHQGVHGSGLLVVIVTGSLLSRYVHQHRQSHIDVGRVDQILLQIVASHDRIAAGWCQHHLQHPSIHPTNHNHKHLVQSIRQIDGRRAPERVSLGDAVDRLPATIVHSEPGHHILCHRAVNPAHSPAPLGLVLVVARDYVDRFGHRRRIQWLSRARQGSGRSPVGDSGLGQRSPRELRHGNGGYEDLRLPVLLGEQASRLEFVLVVGHLRQQGRLLF
ncbi:hypothetical protein MARPO_0075s0005 [Marchantia polymorpha]|uniref:Uncharacterized protein n=1 Tax=Marchantia polymorpha TaxID=3197 RepID=A0A2R6WM12_MARPO|nr:hypothetical protein MARPO_0075s0005 [Marchantia polymorpha]|eukprot:PTQ34875.1 hypothetical protein MARPO_0075s0005 [Marchantia polymorpha]